MANNSVFERFSEIATKLPNHAAISDDAGQLTYAELLAGAQRLASQISKLDLPNHDPIGIFLPSGRDWAISVLGVLAAGHFYVPIDPYFPDVRNARILKCANVAAAITQKATVTSHAIDIGGRSI